MIAVIQQLRWCERWYSLRSRVVLWETGLSELCKRVIKNFAQLFIIESCAMTPTLALSHLEQGYRRVTRDQWRDHIEMVKDNLVYYDEKKLCEWYEGDCSRFGFRHFYVATSLADDIVVLKNPWYCTRRRCAKQNLLFLQLVMLYTTKTNKIVVPTIKPSKIGLREDVRP